MTAPAVYTVPEVAELLGLSEWRIYELSRRGELTFRSLRLGRSVRFVRAEVDKALGLGATE